MYGEDVQDMRERLGGLVAGRARGHRMPEQPDKGR